MDIDEDNTRETVESIDTSYEGDYYFYVVPGDRQTKKEIDPSMPIMKEISYHSLNKESPYIIYILLGIVTSFSPISAMWLSNFNICITIIFGIPLIIPIYIIYDSFKDHYYTIVSMKYNDSAVNLVLRDGTKINIPWNDIIKILYNRATERIFIWDGKKRIGGVYPQHFADAVAKQFVNITGREYKVVWSPLE